jgi:hypothetical protein
MKSCTKKNFERSRNLLRLLANLWIKITNGKEPPKFLFVGIIKVIHKKRDLQDIRNYRPITLLNVDYKILMKVMAEKLNPILGKVIRPQQNGFIRGKSIRNNI